MPAEKELYQIWEENANRFRNMFSTDNRQITILSPGTKNPSGGPDFVEAIIMIGGKVLTGDIEIHINSSDWSLHGHNRDRKYNNVILHVVINDDGVSARNSRGQKIPTLVLPEEYLSKTQTNKKCKLAHTDKAEIENLIAEFGLNRFKRKSLCFQNRLFSEPADQILYEGICDALGYSRNREPLRLLSKLLPIKLLYSIADRHSNRLEPLSVFECLLLGGAGFLSEKEKGNLICPQEYRQPMKRLWQRFKRTYKLQEISPHKWNFKGARPYNSPLYRVLTIPRIIGKLYPSSISQVIISKFASNRGSKEIKNWLFSIFQKPIGLWKNHPCFNGKGPRKLIGDRRTSDIAINILLPFIHAWGNNYRDNNTINKAFKISEALPPGEIPGFIRRLLFRLDIAPHEIKNNVELQGWIEFYKSYCEKGLCILCPLSEI